MMPATKETTVERHVSKASETIKDIDSLHVLGEAQHKVRRVKYV